MAPDLELEIAYGNERAREWLAPCGMSAHTMAGLHAFERAETRGM